MNFLPWYFKTEHTIILIVLLLFFTTVDSIKSLVFDQFFRHDYDNRGAKI